RSQGAARFLERDSRARGPGAYRAGLDPLHGRSRALPRDRLYRLRPSARARHGRRGHREFEADHLYRHRRRSAVAVGEADRPERHRHGGAVRHLASRLRPRQASARSHHRAVARQARPALAAFRAVARRRLHRADGPLKGQFPMSVAVAANERREEAREPAFGFWRRSLAMVIKEFIQLRRDRVSFAMIVMIPVMQLLLFGYAINTTPRDLP